MNVPPIPRILPQPFEWIYIPVGKVNLYPDNDLNDKHKSYDVPAFVIGKYPITNAQYRVFRKREFVITGDDHPATNVSWHDALDFCRWLSAKTNLDIRLPTEQQWQRAAIGDNAWLYPWGNEFDETRCNTKQFGLGTTTPVTYHEEGASLFGVMDMCGNVFEATLNRWGTGDVTIPPPHYRPNAPRVWRGGSWNHEADKCTAIFRAASMPPYGIEFFGFRIVAILDE